MNPLLNSSALRKSAKWLVLIAIAAVVFFRVKFAAVPVEAFEVQPGTVTAQVMGTGTLEARVKTTISPRIQERLVEVLVDQGDTVSTGQLLARLDDGELKRQVEVAEATLASAEATAARVRVDETRAAAVEQQARQEHNRVSDLVAKQISSQAEMDKAVEQLSVAESERNRARAAILEAQQQVVTAERNLAYQRERLDFTRMHSPYDGLVIQRNRDPGGVVVPGSAILQLISTNEFWISAWVDETASTGLAPGQNARVVFRSEASKEYPGEVARLGRQTDPETREFLVDVQVRELPRNWTVGQRAEVWIETGHKTDVMAVPPVCLRWLAGRLGVFVAENGRASWREVKLGLHGRDRVEITEGLSPGERVVVPARPQQSPLKHGQRITAK